jgi:pyridoxamine 5'-phosphate oxidase family protein
MGVFTDAELEFLSAQRIARIATASSGGQPDVSAVGFGIEANGDVVTGGMDITKTVRYRHLKENARAAIVIDELVTVDPWFPRGVKVRGTVALEDPGDGRTRIRITPEVVWSWGINEGAEKRFASIERRDVR